MIVMIIIVCVRNATSTSVLTCKLKAVSSMIVAKCAAMRCPFSKVSYAITGTSKMSFTGLSEIWNHFDTTWRRSFDGVEPFMKPAGFWRRALAVERSIMESQSFFSQGDFPGRHRSPQRSLP